MVVVVLLAGRSLDPESSPGGSGLGRWRSERGLSGITMDSPRFSVSRTQVVRHSNPFTVWLQSQDFDTYSLMLGIRSIVQGLYRSFR